MKATKITSYTLVGVITEKRPTLIGNCFSVETEDGEEYRIVNFYLENLKHLLRKKLITWPIEIGHTDKESKVIITDSRIPPEWYRDHYCRVCYGDDK